MRATFHLDDDIYEAVRSLAVIERTSVGRILSRLARRALNPDRVARAARGGFPVFDAPAGSAPLTPDMVRAALEDRD